MVIIILPIERFVHTMNCIDGICYNEDSVSTSKTEVSCKSGEIDSNFIWNTTLCLIIYLLSYQHLKMREIYRDYDWSLKYLCMPKRNTITRLLYALIYIPILCFELLKIVTSYITLIIIINYIYNKLLNSNVQQQSVHHPVNNNNRQEHNDDSVVLDEPIYINISPPHVVINISDE